MIKVIGLALYGAKTASTRQRLLQYIPDLLTYGIDLKVHYLLDDDYIEKTFSGGSPSILSIIRSYYCRIQMLLKARNVDLIILHCELLPFAPYWFEKILLRFPYIYDFDDAFFLKYKRGKYAYMSPILGNKFDSVIRSARYVTAGSRYLYEYSNFLNTNVKLLPTVINTEKQQYYNIAIKSEKIFTIGWIGSPSTAKYLESIVEPLSIIGKECKIHFNVIGGKAPYIPNIKINEIDWDLNTEIDNLSKFDVGIMPVPDTEWARGKCAYKLIQYLGSSIPVVASKVGANIDVVTSDCGFLVNNCNELASALRVLRDNPKLRIEYGNAGRERAVEKYSLSVNLPIFASIIKKIVQ